MYDASIGDDNAFLYFHSGSGYTAGNTSTSSGGWKCFKVWLVIEKEGNEKLVEGIN